MLPRLLVPQLTADSKRSTLEPNLMKKYHLSQLMARMGSKLCFRFPALALGGPLLQGKKPLRVVRREWGPVEN